MTVKNELTKKEACDVLRCFVASCWWPKSNMCLAWAFHNVFPSMEECKAGSYKDLAKKLGNPLVIGVTDRMMKRIMSTMCIFNARSSGGGRWNLTGTVHFQIFHAAWIMALFPQNIFEVTDDKSDAAYKASISMIQSIYAWSNHFRLKKPSRETLPMLLDLFSALTQYLMAFKVIIAYILHCLFLH